MSEKIRVVLVDDHPLWCQGVASTLSAQSDFEIVGQGNNADQALQLAGDLMPDLILLDVSMSGGGINAAKAIAATYPIIKIIILTVSEDEETVLAALKAGARGYVLKGVSGPELIRIVRGVYDGEAYITPNLAASLLMESQEQTNIAKPSSISLEKLTYREQQILERLARGLSNKQIALDLSLSEKTIKHYMTNILQKLHVQNRVEAALLAQKTFS